ETKLPFFVGQDQQPSLRVSQLDRRVHKRGQHLLQCWSAMQHLRHLKQQAQMMKLGCGTFRCLADLLEKAGQQRLFRDESQLVGVGHSETDLISTFEKVRVVHPLAVDKGAVPAATVLDPETLRRLDNLRMTARDAIVEQYQIVIPLASKGEDGPGNLHIGLIS